MTNPPVRLNSSADAENAGAPSTAQHLHQSHHAGSRKKFRVRHDRTVSLDPYDDGFGIMKHTQTAKPQVFRTGDGWFAHNLAKNLAQM